MSYFKKIKYLFLTPFSLLWELLYQLRRAAYEYGVLKKEYFKVPIISVGNITFGGTGKTPLIIWLVNKIESYGLDSAVLSRGYKSSLENSYGLIRGGERFLSNPGQYGDEPLLIAKKMKRGGVIVGKKRAENLKRYFYEILPDVVLLDDGFQHIQLYRSYNIVLFDALLPLEQYKTAPLGYLREGLSSLKAADAIIVSRADQVDDEQLENLLSKLSKYHRRGIPIGTFCYEPKGVFNCFGEKAFELEELKDKSIIAFTGIASPESFYNLIENNGGRISKKLVYPDHHSFTKEDIQEILSESVRLDAIILCSEKDMVKVKKVTKDQRVLFIDISVKFLSGEEDLLDKVRAILHLDNN